LTSHLRATFQSLIVSRNYRRYIAGQSVSLAGTWMQSVAQGWLVLQLTGSGTAVGLVTAFQFVPVLLFGTLGGVIVDRVDTKRLLVVTSTVFGVLALTLGILTITDTVQLWMVFAIAAGFGLVTVVDNPARQTFVLQLVGPDNLANAITLNSVNINLARVVGPAFAALLISTVGIGPCFIANAVSYLFVIVALLAVSRAELHPRVIAARAKGQVREGLRYVRSSPALRTPLVMMVLIGTLAYEFQVSLPIMAKYTFGGTAGTYGIMTGAMGVGAVLGGLATASRSRQGLLPLVQISGVFGVLILLVAVSPTLPVAVVSLVAVGAASIMFLARANTTLQLSADPAMRGRVMALWTVAFLGSTPVGGPIIGWIGQHVGARWALSIGGVTCLVAAAYGAWQHRLVATEAHDEAPTPALVGTVAGS
jgi:MFS family permease